MAPDKPSLSVFTPLVVLSHVVLGLVVGPTEHSQSDGISILRLGYKNTVPSILVVLSPYLLSHLLWGKPAVITWGYVIREAHRIKNWGLQPITSEAQRAAINHMGELGSRFSTLVEALADSLTTTSWKTPNQSQSLVPPRLLALRNCVAW